MPISYKDNKDAWTEGYLDPSNRFIHLESARIGCTNPPKTLITVGGHIYTYSPGYVPKRMDFEKHMTMPIFITNMTQTLLEFPEHWSFDKNDISHVTNEEAVASFLNQELKTVKSFTSTKHISEVTKVMEYFSLISESPGHIFNFNCNMGI